MACKLVREEGVFAETYSGANVVAAIRLAERLGSTAITTNSSGIGLYFYNARWLRMHLTE